MVTVRTLRQTISAVQDKLWYGTVFAFLALVSGALLVIELLVGGLSRETILRIHETDLAIAYLFLGDFFVGIACSLDRRKYLKENWLNLASSIPVSQEAFRALRLLRFIRALRTIRVALNAKQAFARRNRLKQNHTHG